MAMYKNLTALLTELEFKKGLKTKKPSRRKAFSDA
jgi:hypothetical protein